MNIKLVKLLLYMNYKYNMSNFDLNISNYSVEDILNLFNLSYNFDQNELKKPNK